MSNAGAAQALGVAVKSVSKWRRQFAAMRNAGPRPAAAREASGARPSPREQGWRRRLWRTLMPPPDVELILDQLNRQLAVLEGARAELEAGWVQGGWWSVSSPDGGHRLVTGDAGGSPAHVDGSCLVGALARAGSSADVGRAVDAVYDALWASRGQPSTPGLPPLPAPEVRQARVRTLTQWNDRAGRTQEEVLAVVDRAISATIMDLMSAPRPSQPAGASPGIRAG
jgi:hypothetical protein